MSAKEKFSNPFLNIFKSEISEIALPELFTNPFAYKPHPLCEQAAKELQQYLNNKQKGKMYGVLVVETKNKQLGYLAAVSGNANNAETFKKFVPPIYDLSKTNDFFKIEEAELSLLNKQIEKLENSTELVSLLNEIQIVKQKAENEIQRIKQEIKASKTVRDKKRERAKGENVEQLEKDLIRESQRQKSELTQRKQFWKKEITTTENIHKHFLDNISKLKKERKEKSAKLQLQLFEQYSFYNAGKKVQNLLDIFKNTDQKVPPAAAGECAAPKLLQYAFINNLKPIAMAEFWWGTSPKSEIRKHGYFYPACQRKCKPILGFMLKGLNVEPDPLNDTQNIKPNIEIIYSDNILLVIHKPHNLLSVPGKTNADSVYSQVKANYPEARGPLIVHRLDMDTSGLMIIALKKEAHKHLQKQFLTRSINKCYVALLDGLIKHEEGFVDLPLRVDLNDRPRQLVCYENGKPAKTKYKIIMQTKDKTVVQFFPITGRTHQLRVHAAHQNGLNTPIVGDRLYGKEADRLYLHAEKIQFIHPESGKKMSFIKKAGF